MTAWPQKIPGPLEHGVGEDHVLEHVIHGNHVVCPELTTQIGGFQRALEHVVAASPALGGNLGLNLDAGTFQVEEPPELVEMATVTGPDVEYATGTARYQPTVKPSP